MVDRRVKVTAELDAKGMVEGARQAEAAVAKTGTAMKRTADQTEQASKSQESAFRRMARSAEDNSRAWSTAGTAIAAFGAVTTAALVGSAKAAVDWESAFAGVRKTVEDSETGYAALSEELREMARTLPAAHDEIAGVAQAAGQLGIERENVTAFTRTMIDMGESTNMSADQAATALARFANVMGTSQSEFSNIGSAVVGLGNNFATTEGEIVDMSMRLAGAGRQAKMTEGDVLGIATALSSLGIESQAGGTAFSRVITEMGIAVDTNNDKLRTFAEVAGVSAEEFRTQWGDNPGSAVSAFIEGLGRMQASGQSLEPTLDDLSMTDIRIGDALRRSASASDLFAEAMARGNKDYAENVALTREAEQRYETVASQLQVFKNNVVDAGISMGEVFLPALSGLAGAASEAFQWIGGLPKPLQQIAGFAGAAAGGVSLLAGGFLLMAPRAIETYRALQTLGIITPGVTTNLRKMAGFMTGPWGLAIAGSIAAIGYFVNENRKKKAAIEEVRQTLDEETGALTENTRAWAGKKAQDEGLLDMADQLGLRQGLIVDAIMDEAGARDELTAATKAHLDEWARQDMMAGESSRQLGQNADAARKLNDAVGGLGDTTEAAVSKQIRLNAEVEAGAEATRNSTLAWADMAFAMRDYAASQGVATTSINEWMPAMERAAMLGEEAADAYAKWIEEVAGASGAFVSTSEALANVNQATQDWAQAQADATDSADDSWEDFWDGQSISIDEYLAELERMLQAQSDWEQNMVILATQASTEVVDAFRDMGPDAAVLLQELLDEGTSAMDRMGDILEEGGTAGPARFAEAMANSAVFEGVGERWGDAIMNEVTAKFLAGEITLQEIVDTYDLNTTIMMDGNPEPFELALGAAIGLGDGSTAIPAIDGDASGFEAALNAGLDLGNSSEATAAILGDAAGFGAELGAALGTADASSATAAIEGNAARLYGTVDGALGWINNQSATVSVYARMRTTAASIVSNLRSSLGSIGFPGYMAGGYTGDFATSEPAGIVHGKEFVSTASTTADPYNRQALEFMHSGRSMREWAPPAVAPQAQVSQPALVGAGASASQQPIVVSVQVDSREIARANAVGAANLGPTLNRGGY